MSSYCINLLNPIRLYPQFNIKMCKTIKFTLFLLITTYSVHAQRFTQDVGFFIGTGSIQTDYGQRGNFLSSYGNRVISLSLTHYVQFFNLANNYNSDSYFVSHIMLKSELNIETKERFDHHGKYVVGDGILAQKLRAMHGDISIATVGVAFEYYLNNLKDFYTFDLQKKWNPYITVGYKYAFYKNSLTSDLGDWRTDITVLPAKYQVPNALAIGSGTANSFTLGLGFRYKLSRKFDLSSIFNWQYFLSDKIDGLQASVQGSKNNEWLTNIQIGIIYHLNFSNAFCKI